MADKARTFHLTIKTPLETILSKDVVSLVVDSEEGKMMILPHHTALVASIGFSNILVKSDDKVQEYSVRNGFINVDNSLNKVELLTLNCEQTQTVKYTSVENYLKFLEDELKGDKLNTYQLEFLENEQFAVVKQLKTMKKKEENK